MKYAFIEYEREKEKQSIRMGGVLYGSPLRLKDINIFWR